MSISYSGIVGNKGKGTLPSVESWSGLGDQSILKDPPKSITTRRIDKVNADGSLNEMLYHSGDRFAENINVYARGVNPMVSVEYGNVGSFTSVGANSNGSGVFGNGAPGKLPYRILNDGAFRPPILRMEQLMPLSRQPRLVTQCMTTPQFLDYTKKASCPLPSEKKQRQVHANVMHAYTVPTKVVKFQEPVKEHFEVKYVIENPIRGSAITNISAKSNLQQENMNPLRQVNRETKKYSYNANSSGIAQQNYIHDDIELDRNMPLSSAEAAKSRNIQENLRPDNELELENNMPNYNAHTNRSANYFTRLDDEGEVILDRNLPNYNTQTNVSDKRKFVNVAPDNEYEFYSKTAATDVTVSKTSNRAKTENHRGEYNLPDTLDVGGFKVKANVPVKDRDSALINPNYITSKQTIAEKVRAAQNERGNRNFRHF